MLAASPAPPLVNRNDRERIVYVETMGCQMNVYDSERMLESLGHAGYRQADRPDGADLIVINTCSVRDRSEHKMTSLLGALRPLKEHNPELVLAVAGCVATQEGERLLRRAPQLDLILGPDQVGQIAAMVADVRDRRTNESNSAAERRVVDVAMVDRKAYEFVVPEPPQDRRVTSFVTVMKGCNKFCSFCIVPTTRGREVSKPTASVVAEARMLADHGVREITLLGQNVNSYGNDRRDEADFTGLIEAVSAVEGIERIRFTTSHPMDCSDRLIDAFARLPKLMPSFHLPIQSGSERVLRMMRRRTVIEDYVARIERLRQARPDIAMTTDIIVGFPGETDDDFEETMALLQRVRYASIFSFSYSPRPGTAAARIDDDVLGPLKKARLHRVQALQNAISSEWLTSFAGAELELLFEGASTAHAAGPDSQSVVARVGRSPQLMGRTPHNIKVNIETDDFYALAQWPGRRAIARMTHIGRHSMNGELVRWVDDVSAPQAPMA